MVTVRRSREYRNGADPFSAVFQKERAAAKTEADEAVRADGAEDGLAGLSAAPADGHPAAVADGKPSRCNVRADAEGSDFGWICGNT